MDQDDEQPEPDPTNYQFYFNKVQIVGKISFKEDHDKLFGNGYSKHNSLQVSPNTKSSSTKVRFIMIQNYSISPISPIKLKYKEPLNEQKTAEVLMKSNDDKEKNNDGIIKETDNKIEELQSRCCYIF